MSRDHGDYLEDILYSIDAIEEFTYGLELEDFLEDEKKRKRTDIARNPKITIIKTYKYHN